MSSCEKCWSDAHGNGAYSDAATNYQRLLDERKDNPCTPEQQAGPDASPCTECGNRMVRHQHTGECMANPEHGYRYTWRKPKTEDETRSDK